MRATLYHINLSPALGGAEVYTHFFLRALTAGGWPCELIVRHDAHFWSEFDFADAPLHRINGSQDLRMLLASAQQPALFIIHAPLAKEMLTLFSNHHLIIGLAHQAIYNGRYPDYYAHAQLLFSVSGHVSNTLNTAGLKPVYPLPLFGVAETLRTHVDSNLIRNPLFDADKRKWRDVVLSASQRLFGHVTTSKKFVKRDGITLGIVSRIAPLKQFPALIHIIAPILVRYPQIHLEIFGSGVGYAPLRDVQKSLGPLAKRVRYWGFQRDVAACYQSIDYLLTGLPEREALGLNVIEAQSCGTPVLAVNAPPFTETMIEGKTGFLFTDPREDGGNDFERVLQTIIALNTKIDPRTEVAHLARFSFAEFCRRADAAIAYAVNQFAAQTKQHE